MLGFPIIHIETCIYGYSCLNDGIYDVLRRFPQGKGLNPESQEAAINLGYPLYKLADEEVPLACCKPKFNKPIPLFSLLYLKVESEFGHRSRCNLQDTALCQKLGHYL
jgi:hypothetical protein